MLNQKTIEKVVFIDIETVPRHETLAQCTTRMQKAFKEKFNKEATENHIKSEMANADFSLDEMFEEIYNQKAPIYAEFNKIVCISMGLIDTTNKEQYKLKVKSFCNEDEKALLQDFIKAKAIAEFNPNNSKDNFAFCAHNGKIFDFPVIAKRLIYNGIDLPYIFDFSEMKPWDINYFIDTKEAWKFGVFDGNVSLDLLAACFDVESSKMIMKGSDVKDVYYVTKDMKSIQNYCEHDIFTLANIYLKMKNIQIHLVR